MPKPEERMELIRASVMEQARQQHDELVRQAEQIKQTELAQYEEQLIEHMYTKIQAAIDHIHLESAERRAGAEAGARRELLELRRQLAESVFAQARVRLVAYTKTQPYRDALLREIGALRDRYDHADSIVGLRAADLELAGAVRERLGANCEVRADSAIEIGGFTLENKPAGQYVDGTLDLRLREQRPWFYENSGLRVR